MHFCAEEFTSLLLKCRKDRNLVQALRVRDVFLSQSELQVHAGSLLVSVLVELGSMCHAREVFDRLDHRNEHLWNTLITGYVKHAEPQHALSLYHTLHRDHSLCPSDYAFVSLLTACSVTKDLQNGHILHAEVARKGLLRNNIFVGCSLVDMYAKCNHLAKAHEVFEGLPARDVVSWNALVTAYIESGCTNKAIECLERMRHDGVPGNAVTFICSLKACASIGSIVKGEEIHNEIVTKGFETDLLIRNTLIDMYAKCGSLATAQEVFNKLPCRDVVSWNTLLGGLLDQGQCEEVLSCFTEMQRDGISLNNITSCCFLKACSVVASTVKGQEIHVEIVNKGLERGPLIGSSLVDMYAKCGALVEAQEVFDKLPVPDVVSWTALMAGYAEHGNAEEALDCFEQMQQVGITPDAFTFSCSLKACGCIRATERGQEIHADIARKGLENEILVGNTLVNMYASCGLVTTAEVVFDKLPVQDMVSLNALIIAYTESGCGEKAINCFEQMQLKGVPLNSITIICSLKACCSIGSVVKGRETYLKIVKTGLEQELPVGNCLIDLYVKNSMIVEAQAVFEKLVDRDVVSWTALMAGYAQLGESNEVLIIFDRMREQGIKPTLITFVHVLNACNHAGLVKEGQMYFRAISDVYDFSPVVDHYTCMIDLLGRAGHVDKAMALIKRMPMQPDLVVWQTLLGACRKWGEVGLGRHAFEQALRLDLQAEATYLFMLNIYKDASMHEAAIEIEAMRLEAMR